MARSGDPIRRTVTIVLTLLTASGNPAPASEASGLERETPLEAPSLPGGTLENDGLDNLVVRRTITALGNRFYDAFARAWRDQTIEARGVITVEERPWMSEGTEVVIRYQHEVIQRLRVWPRNPGPEEVAEATAARVAQIIQRYQRPLGGNGEGKQGLEE